MGFCHRHELLHISGAFSHYVVAVLKTHFGNHAWFAVGVEHIVYSGKHSVHHVGDGGGGFLLAGYGAEVCRTCFVLRVNRHAHNVEVHFVLAQHVEGGLVFAHIHSAVEVDYYLGVGQHLAYCFAAGFHISGEVLRVGSVRQFAVGDGV